MEYIYDYYEKNGSYPSVSEIKERLNCFRDLIAYRIVISMPRCHMKQKQDRKKEEIRYLYRIANVLPQFLEERGFTAERQVGLKEVILYYWMMLCAHITGIILMGKVQIHIVRFI